jgi:hypothetical protein
LAQNQVNQDRMGAAVFTTGPYMAMAISAMTPMTPSVEDGVVTWRVPLGSGAVAHVDLEDCGYYVRWLFDNSERANGMNLEVAIEHVEYKKLAAAFAKVTGHPAQYIDTDLDAYWRSGPLRMAAGRPTGYNADPNDKSTMSFQDNFSGFWNIWKYGVVKRDYAVLDEIHPNRIRSVEQWLTSTVQVIYNDFRISFDFDSRSIRSKDAPCTQVDERVCLVSRRSRDRSDYPHSCHNLSVQSSRSSRYPDSSGVLFPPWPQQSSNPSR